MRLTLCLLRRSLGLHLLKALADSAQRAFEVLDLALQRIDLLVVDWRCNGGHSPRHRPPGRRALPSGQTGGACHVPPTASASTASTMAVSESHPEAASRDRGTRSRNAGAKSHAAPRHRPHPARSRSISCRHCRFSFPCPCLSFSGRHPGRYLWPGRRGPHPDRVRRDPGLDLCRRLPAALFVVRHRKAPARGLFLHPSRPVPFHHLSASSPPCLCPCIAFLPPR